MAKFKVGDKVRLKKTGQVGTITRVFTDWGLINYWVKGLPGGPTDSPLYAEDRLELANSRACNALKLEPFNPNSVRLGKSVWYKGREMTYKGKSGGNVHLIDLDGNRIDVPVFDRNLKMLADAYEYYHNDGVPMPNSRVRNASVPSGWKVVKESRDSWYGDYLALVQSESDPSKWAYFTSGKLGKPESKSEAEKDYMDLATRTFNSRACNDQWIDDFHVIVTSGKPDASLLSALKDKATAWKLSKKNFSDRTAADRHNAAESKVYDIARRLGAKVIQQGAVMKVVMPNSRACNSTNPVVANAMKEVRNSKICKGTNTVVCKALNAVARTVSAPKIKGKGPISMDDDIVAVYKPDGKLEWRGYFDDCTYRYDKMKYDPSTKTYRVDGPGGDYRILALNNSRAYNSTNPIVANAIACRTTVCNASVPSEIVTYVKTLEQASALIDKVRSSNRSIVRKIESLPEGSSERIAAAKMFNDAHENARYVSMDMCVTGVDIPSRY